MPREVSRVFNSNAGGLGRLRHCDRSETVITSLYIYPPSLLLFIYVYFYIYLS